MIALALCETLVAWAVFFQSLELLSLRREFSSRGIWRWKTIAPEFGLLARIFRGVLGDRSFSWLLVFQAVAAAAIAGGSGQYLPLCLALGCLLVSMRFRGAFNGGSDCMTLVVLGSVAGARAMGSSPRAELVALGYIGVQSALSYGVAGWAKLKEPCWRDGSALGLFMRFPQYAWPRPLAALLGSSAISRLSCWAVIAGELGFFVVLGATALGFKLSLAAAAWVLIFGAVFHLVNFWAFGLNRFFWAWLSSYPALFFWLTGFG
ncbi:MAG: hypothetical protein ACK5QT_05365 [Oligoflexia bacterium]